MGTFLNSIKGAVRKCANECADVQMCNRCFPQLYKGNGREMCKWADKKENVQMGR